MAHVRVCIERAVYHVCVRVCVLNVQSGRVITHLISLLRGIGDGVGKGGAWSTRSCSARLPAARADKLAAWAALER